MIQVKNPIRSVGLIDVPVKIYQDVTSVINLRRPSGPGHRQGADGVPAGHSGQLADAEARGALGLHGQRAGRPPVRVPGVRRRGDEEVKQLYRLFRH